MRIHCDCQPGPSGNVRVSHSNHTTPSEAGPALLPLAPASGLQQHLPGNMQGRKEQSQGMAPQTHPGTLLESERCERASWDVVPRPPAGLWAGRMGSCQLPSPKLGVSPAQALFSPFLFPVLPGELGPAAAPPCARSPLCEVGVIVCGCSAGTVSI